MSISTTCWGREAIQEDSEVEASLGYTAISCLKKWKRNFVYKIRGIGQIWLPGHSCLTPVLLHWSSLFPACIL
jgi:hypothetical protein